MRRTTNVPLEADEQKLLFRWAGLLSVLHPELKRLYAIPNGGSRNVIEARNLRLQGVKAGVPDICLPVARGGYNALYIELKRKKGGKLSEEQRDWINALNNEGNLAVVCKGFDEARDVITKYLNIKSSSAKKR